MPFAPTTSTPSSSVSQEAISPAVGVSPTRPRPLAPYESVSVRTVLAAGLAIAISGTAAAYDFRKQALPLLPTSSIDVYAPAWGDFDGDGLTDILLPSLSLVGTESVLLRNTGSRFEHLDGIFRATTGLSKSGAVWVDTDNDADLDLYEITTSFQGDTLYLNQGQGSLVTDGPGPTIPGAGSGQSVLASDFDGDGLADIFVTNGGGYGNQQNVLLRAQQDGKLTPWAPNPITQESLASHGAAAADFDPPSNVETFFAQRQLVASRLLA